MNCPRCKDKMFVQRTYIADSVGESRDLHCIACGFKASSVTFLIQHGDVKRIRRGRASKALADRIMRGEIRSPLDDGQVGGT